MIFIIYTYSYVGKYRKYTDTKLFYNIKTIFNYQLQKQYLFNTFYTNMFTHKTTVMYINICNIIPVTDKKKNVIYYSNVNSELNNQYINIYMQYKYSKTSNLKI